MSDPRWTEATEELIARELYGWSTNVTEDLGEVSPGYDEDDQDVRDICHEGARQFLTALADAGVLVPTPSLPRTFELPAIPADVTKLRDQTGRIWTSVNTGYRIWRFMTLRHTDASLLSSIYGPTFTEVTS